MMEHRYDQGEGGSSSFLPVEISREGMRTDHGAPAAENDMTGVPSKLSLLVQTGAHSCMVGHQRRNEARARPQDLFCWQGSEVSDD
mmetsp:Transcript_24437/g.49516  ORF Transcript_24437/g.49516 Transcript_24437/m.49516 type:complete len:86 (+) Transcript_24437:673-930(+)